MSGLIRTTNRSVGVDILKHGGKIPSVSRDFSTPASPPATLYGVRSGVLAPLLGATSATSYAGWTRVLDESVDDGFLLFTGWPFLLTLDSVTYNEVYVSSNGYLTFGAGSDEFNTSFSSPALPKLMLGSDDLSYQRVYTQTNADNVKVRWEGSDSTSGTPGSSNRIVEVTFFEPQASKQLIEVRTGTLDASYSAPFYFGIATASTALAEGAVSASSSWVFAGNSSGTSWELVSGVHVGDDGEVIVPPLQLLLTPLAPTVSPAAADPDFSSVSLLLPFDGSFADSSSNGLTAVVTGDAVISTSDARWGSGCALFNGTGLLSYSSSTLFDLGSGSSLFTAELWYRPSSLPGTDNALISQRNSSAITTFELRNWNDRLQLLVGNADLTAWVYTATSDPGTITANSYHFIQLYCDGSSLQVRVNENLILSQNPMPVWASANRPFYVGKGPDGGVVGRIDDLRVTKGVLRSFGIPSAAFRTS